LLDYGCGYGSLLGMFAGSEVQAFGYEPSAARQATAGQGDIEIFNSLDGVAAAGPFDLIVCTEVLEHLADPRAALRFMKQQASPRALLAVTVPDCERSYVAACLAGLGTERRLPPVLNPWEHLNYFSAATLRRLLAEEGFTVVHDFGCAAAVRDACAQFGDPGINPVVNGLRILKRAAAASPSTQLFCELP
jgi:2-polyprenyl-3-methyl-5-hydroxy-6-metoxy-1,4-benzoquinol methylase